MNYCFPNTTLSVFVLTQSRLVAVQSSAQRLINGHQSDQTAVLLSEERVNKSFVKRSYRLYHWQNACYKIIDWSFSCCCRVPDLH